MGLFVRSLTDILKTEGEAFVVNVINSFSCRHNKDVDTYLREDAILFTVMSSSVTHFVLIPKAAYAWRISHWHTSL